MLNKKILTAFFATVSSFVVLAVFSQLAFAAPPVVKTVPWVASNPLIPHDTWSGESIRLKGTSDQQGANFIYTWDFGDGSPIATGTVTNMYAVEAQHAYTGVAGTVFTATLTIQDTSIAAPNTGTAKYYVVIQNKSLPVEVNVAIDEGLWYLHKNMSRTSNYGYWGVSYYSEVPANLNAFFVNGHLETGAASNPYTETVQRGMRFLFSSLLYSTSIPANQTYTDPDGGAPVTVTVDSNGNGIAIYGYDSYTYSTGIYMDAIVASGTPDAVAPAGGANIVGRKYKDIVQDMVDGYAYGQSDYGTWMGGWGYDWNNQNSDNSVNQWAVIGMLGAEGWGGVVVPAFVKTANINSLDHTQATTANCSASYDGAFSYTNNYCYFPWGPYGTTPAGMVQMVFDGIGRGDARWNRTENFIRNNFCSTSTSSQASIRNYYYGLFSFTKAMLLYPGGELQFLANQPGSTNPLDWYSAEAIAGDQCDGVARRLINDQLAAGNWPLKNDYGYHTGFSTAWAIIMLNRTVFASGLPVAVAQAIPNPAVAGQTINLSGAGSFHQDSSKTIVSWVWDLDNNGSFEFAGVTATVSFGAVGNYPVLLRVTDDIGQISTTTLTLVISTPPLAPSANAGGPYNLCEGRKWFLNGSASINPDNGQSEPGQPPDYIKEYAWELDGDNAFDDRTGATPEVTGFAGFTAGSHVIQLRVTDNTAISFPSSGMPDLVSVDSAIVNIRTANDPACACISNLAARPKLSKVQLTWTPTGAHHYNIYRGTISGGPYLKIASTPSTYSTYLDTTVSAGNTYYYVVRPATIIDEEICQSSEARAIVTTR